MPISVEQPIAKAIGTPQGRAQRDSDQDRAHSALELELAGVAGAHALSRIDDLLDEVEDHQRAGDGRREVVDRGVMSSAPICCGRTSMLSFRP